MRNFCCVLDISFLHGGYRRCIGHAVAADDPPYRSHGAGHVPDAPCCANVQCLRSTSTLAECWDGANLWRYSGAYYQRCKLSVNFPVALPPSRLTHPGCPAGNQSGSVAGRHPQQGFFNCDGKTLTPRMINTSSERLMIWPRQPVGPQTQGWSFSTAMSRAVAQQGHYLSGQRRNDHSRRA